MSENVGLVEDPLSALLRHIDFSAQVFFRQGYCGNWAVDTSGSTLAPFHLVAEGHGWLHEPTPDSGSGFEEAQPPKKLLPGQLVFFPRDGAHVLAATETTPDPALINRPAPERLEGNVTRLVCGYFRFDQRRAAPLLSSLPDSVVLDMAQATQADGRELINLWMREAAYSGFGSDLAVDRLAEVVFVQLLRQEIDSGRLKGVMGALGDPMLGPVLAKIHRSPGRPHTLPSMAQATGLSESAFTQRFKKHIGQTPGQYVRFWRMQAAASQLTSTSRSILDIATQVGYDSEVAFRKAFKATMGIAPGAYRRKDDQMLS
ncbi:MAG: cupin domain-containing protein [Lysobacterales bacterium]